MCKKQKFNSRYMNENIYTFISREKYLIKKNHESLV